MHRSCHNISSAEFTAFLGLPGSGVTLATIATGTGRPKERLDIHVSSLTGHHLHADSSGNSGQSGIVGSLVLGAL